LSQIKEHLAQIRDPRASDYSLLLWLVAVFSGGVINAMILRNFADFWLTVYDYYITKNLTVWQAPQIIPAFITSVAIAFSTPILFSFLFTGTHPEKRIVPPLPMQIISFGLLLFFVYHQTATDWQILYGIGFYIMSVALWQDGIVTYALGKTVFTDDIIRRSLKVPANINRVNNIILSKQFQKLNNLKLIDKSRKESIKLRTKARRGFVLILELKESEVKTETIINLVAYHMQAYCIKPIRKADDVYVWAMNMIDTLKGTLTRDLSAQVEDASIDNGDSLLNFVLDDMAGALSRFQEMATTKRVAIVASIIFIAVSIGLFVFDKIDWGLGALAIAIVLIADVALRE
jgi:hypothetical protein